MPVTAAVEKGKGMAIDCVFLQAPYSGEIKEVEAAPEVLVPLLVAGWHQVAAPIDHNPEAAFGIIRDSE
jgi:hypothetical protein